MPSSLHLALLRGINVSGRNLIRMAALRDMCAGLEFTGVRTYIQSGNLIFATAAPIATLEARIEGAIAATFSLTVPVMVRSADQWRAVFRSCPLPKEAASDPSRLYVLTSKLPISDGVAGELAGKARDGEVVRFSGGCLWILYPSGSAGSKLTPALIDRLAGSPVTARNWKTATALTEMLGP